MNLRLDWCASDAARYAVENWHYSKTLPAGKLVKIGVWENNVFIGVVIYSWGANKDLGTPFKLKMTECCELVRVALNKHYTPVSKIISISLKMLKKQSPGLRLVVSFADPVEGHHGGIYQAGNWIYSGKTASSFEYWLNGKRLQKRAYTGSNYGKGRMPLPVGAIKKNTPGKNRYLMPLDDTIRDQIVRLHKPYPKRAGSVVSDTAANQAEKGGANPTSALSVGVNDAG